MHGLAKSIEQVRQLWVEIHLKTAGHDQIDAALEVGLGHFDVARPVFRLSCLVAGAHLFHQDVDRGSGVLEETKERCPAGKGSGAFAYTRSCCGAGAGGCTRTGLTAVCAHPAANTAPAASVTHNVARCLMIVGAARTKSGNAGKPPTADRRAASSLRNGMYSARRRQWDFAVLPIYQVRTRSHTLLAGKKRNATDRRSFLREAWLRPGSSARRSSRSRPPQTACTSRSCDAGSTDAAENPGRFPRSWAATVAFPRLEIDRPVIHRLVLPQQLDPRHRVQ